MFRSGDRESTASGNALVSLPQPLRWFLIALLVLTGVSAAVEVGYHLAGSGYPYDWPFVAPVSRFGDLLEWLPRFASLHTEAFFHQPHPNVYPAPLSMLYGAWRLLGNAALPAYFLLATAVAGLGAVLLLRAFARQGWRRRTALAVFCVLLGTSYPFWFVVYTANLELAVFMLLAVALVLFCHDRPYLAAIFFALAGSMKWTPFLFLLLFANRRHWRALLLAVAVAAAVTAASLWGVYPNLAHAWQQTQAGMSLFVRRDGLHILPGQLGFDHSLLALVKFTVPSLSPAQLTTLWGVLFPVLALLCLALWLLRVRRLPLAEQVLFLTVAMVLFPPVSYDYTLMTLYLPGALVLAAILRQCRERIDARLWALLGCFAVVLTAQGYIILAGDHRSGQLKAVALVGLFVVACFGLNDNVSPLRSYYLRR